MISEEYRQRFKEDLGNIHYAGKVQKILIKKGILTNRGEVASARTINNVFGGHQEHEDIELAINDVYEKEMAKKRTLIEIRKKYTKP